MTGLLFVSGIIDYKYRKIPNLIIILIFGWALLFSSASVFERFAGFLVTAVPLFVLALTTGKIKGGDYKFVVACASALGLNIFTGTLLFACSVALIWSLLRHEDSVPLAFVFLIGYVIFVILCKEVYV